MALISDRSGDSNQTEFMNKTANAYIGLPVIDQLDLMFNTFFMLTLENAMNTNDAIIEDIVNKYKPDVIIIDHIFVCPSLIKSGIPWVFLCSANLLTSLNSESLPPPGFGLSINGNKNEWRKCRVKLTEIMKDYHHKYNAWLREYGLKEIPESSFFYTSPYLTIYDYPKEIDYSNEVSLPSNFHRFDNFIRTEKTDEFVLPDVLRDKPGKLIYLSMGSLASGNVKLMKRLISILAKTPHRFIVSKGELHGEYQLADNMWGQGFLPQTKVLPLVDLIITHGGNNTLTEAFYFGKPMIVLPMFGDQYDNAQRLQETGYGIKLDTLHFTETDLLEAIEKLVNDSELKLKLEIISERIQTSKSVSKVVELVEALVKRE